MSKMNKWQLLTLRAQASQLNAEPTPWPKSCRNYEQGRRSINSWDNKKLIGYKVAFNDEVLVDAMSRILEGGHANTRWYIGTPGGDRVGPWCTEYEPLHSDSWWYPLTSMRFGYNLVVSISCTASKIHVGPIRLRGWDDLKDYNQFPSVEVEANKSACAVLMEPGEMLVRDCRCAHGGSANFSDETLILPGFQVTTPFWKAQQRLARGDACSVKKN